MTSPGEPPVRVAYLGPAGTFTEQALREGVDLPPDAQLLPLPTFADVMRAVESGDVELGFLPIENSIDGTVTVTLDALAFTHDLRIQQEVVLDIHMALMAAPGTTLADVVEVVSIPVAVSQCRAFLAEHLPGVKVSSALSTAGAAQVLAENPRPGVAAIGPAVAGELYGLETVVSGIEDHSGNQTRFVLLAPRGVPAPTGHDKTSVVVYQRADAPGSLLAILQEFAARSINLTKIESRPTKSGGLGDYCFVFDLDGHIADEVVADCLRELHAKQGGVRFLGSYPAAGEAGPARRQQKDAAWTEAERWVASLRDEVVRLPAVPDGA